MLIHDNTNEVYFERMFYVITLNCILADIFWSFCSRYRGENMNRCKNDRLKRERTKATTKISLDY